VRERLITFVCALGALLLFITLFVHGAGGEAQPVILPTTIEARGDGLAGAKQWLEGEGIRTLSLRERFDTLAKRGDLPASGNLLVVTLPTATAYREAESDALARWIRAGNTLLVLAALADRPSWGRAGFASGDLHVLSGLDFAPLSSDAPKRGSMATPPEEGAARTPAPAPSSSARTRESRSDALGRVIEASQRLSEPRSSTLLPNRPDPLLRGVQSVIAWSDFPPPGWTWNMSLPRDGFALALAHARETGEEVLWIRPRGEGNIIVCGFGSIFSNRALGRADNAQLLANIVGASLGGGGAVLFDDEHQGLAAAYDPGKFYKDSRLYATLGVLAAVWFIWVLGSTRLRLPLLRVAAPREAELVQSTGTFLARVLSPPAAARRMYEHFFRHLRARVGRAAADDTPRWEWLAHHPRLARADLEQLREWYAHCHSEGRVPLVALHNLMARIERQLAA